MMYANNFAAAIRVDGKVLREFQDTVYIPFGTEYDIRLKNLKSNRAKVTIEIDGENVTEGGLVIDSFQTVDLERFIRNGNLKEGNKFKFIERSSKIESHRGIRLEDGIITIRYEFEMPILPLNTTRDYYRTDKTWSRSLNSIHTALISNDKGITVEGSKSNQSFSTTSWRGSSGGVNVMSIKLLGETEENKKIREPITVNTRLECKTCGTKNAASSNFCPECGTSLKIFN